MYRLLRNTASGLFLAPDGNYTVERDRAYRFQSFVAAWEFIAKRNMTDMEIVLTFGNNPRYDLRFPMEAARKTDNPIQRAGR